MRLPVLAVLLAFAGSPVAVAQDMSSDPYIWLEEKDSARSLAWVEARNAVTVNTSPGSHR